MPADWPPAGDELTPTMKLKRKPIAAKYAEKVGGEIIQRATVLGCKGGDRPQELVVARYPNLPMSFERICPGFQAVLLEGGGGEVVQKAV